MTLGLARKIIRGLARATSRRRSSAFGVLFDADWYIDQNPDVSAHRDGPLLHFLEHGGYEGRNPHPLFDSNWYAVNGPGLARSGPLPLSHFIKVGANAGYDPHPLFSTRWYLANNPDALSAGLNPLADFILNGLKHARQPHPLFDTGWYLSRYPDVVESGANPLVHYLREGADRGYDPNPYFDSQWYLSRYPDVARDRINPLRHYVEHGAKEGHDPSLRFETDWYRTQNDLPVDENPLGHFLALGIRSGRAPLSRMGLRRNAAVDAARESFVDLAACDPEFAVRITKSAIPALPTRANVPSGPAFAAWKMLLASFDRLYDRMVFVGSLSDVAPGSVAGNALRGCQETEGIGSVILIMTEDGADPNGGSIPKGTHVRSLSQLDHALLRAHRAEIVQKLVYHLQPKFVLNAGSLALWDATAAYGAPLSLGSRIFALFNYPPSDDLDREIVCCLRPSLPYLQQLVLRNPDSVDAVASDFGLSALDGDGPAAYSPLRSPAADRAGAMDSRYRFSDCWFYRPSAGSG